MVSKLEWILMIFIMIQVVFLVVVNLPKDESYIACPYNGTLYYDTADKEVYTFRCDNSGW